MTGFAAQRGLQRNPGQWSVAAGIGAEREQHQRLGSPTCGQAARQQRPQRLGVSGAVTDRQGVQRVPDLNVGQRARQAGQLGLGEWLPVADPSCCRHRVLDITTHTGRRVHPVRLVARRGAFGDQTRERGTASAIVDRDDRLQVGTPGVEPTAVEHRRHRQR